MKTSVGILAILALGLSACGQDNTSKTVATPAEKPAVTASPQPAPAAPAVQVVPEKPAASVQPVVKAEVTGERVYAMCVGCHGAAGEGGVGPKLQGQSVAELANKLAIYKAGKDIGPMSSMMIPNATQLSDKDITLVSEYIATLK